MDHIERSWIGENLLLPSSTSTRRSCIDFRQRLVTPGVFVTVWPTTRRWEGQKIAGTISFHPNNFWQEEKDVQWTHSTCQVADRELEPAFAVGRSFVGQLWAKVTRRLSFQKSAVAQSWWLCEDFLEKSYALLHGISDQYHPVHACFPFYIASWAGLIELREIHQIRTDSEGLGFSPFVNVMLSMLTKISQAVKQLCKPYALVQAWPVAGREKWKPVQNRRQKRVTSRARTWLAAESGREVQKGWINRHCGGRIE